MPYSFTISFIFITAEYIQLGLFWLRNSTKFRLFAYRPWSLSHNHTDHIQKVKGQNLPGISKVNFKDIWQNCWHRPSISMNLIYPGYVSGFSNEKIMSTWTRGYIFIILKSCKFWGYLKKGYERIKLCRCQGHPMTYLCKARAWAMCSCKPFPTLVISTILWPH
jgi:hypothetical protein